jgi:aldose 1-epimerase
VIPTGRQISLQHGDVAAVVTEVGAGLRELTWRGRPLVIGFAQDEIPDAYQGAVLAPWPNRIADGRYRFDGQLHQLDLSEPERFNALHGLVNWAAWDVERAGIAEARLTHRLWPTPGYPFLLDLAVDYRLTDDGLTFGLSAHNAGNTAAPYGGSFHPYLVAGSGDADSWTVQSPAGSYLTVDPNRLLPRGIAPLAEFDFRDPTPLAGLEIDHAFTDIAFDDAGQASLSLIDDAGDGVRMTWDRRCPWLQLCIPGKRRTDLHRTADLYRRALAVEPMTCPPDAFNSEVDLIVLEPGESHSFELTIGGIG